MLLLEKRSNWTAIREILTKRERAVLELVARGFRTARSLESKGQLIHTADPHQEHLPRLAVHPSVDAVGGHAHGAAAPWRWAERTLMHVNRIGWTGCGAGGGG